MCGASTVDEISVYPFLMRSVRSCLSNTDAPSRRPSDDTVPNFEVYTRRLSRSQGPAGGINEAIREGGPSDVDVERRKRRVHVKHEDPRIVCKRHTRTHAANQPTHSVTSACRSWVSDPVAEPDTGILVLTVSFSNEASTIFMPVAVPARALDMAKNRSMADADRTLQTPKKGRRTVTRALFRWWTKPITDRRRNFSHTCQPYKQVHRHSKQTLGRHWTTTPLLFSQSPRSRA